MGSSGPYEWPAVAIAFVAGNPATTLVLTASQTFTRRKISGAS